MPANVDSFDLFRTYSTMKQSVHLFRGTGTALVTPFTDEGAIDWSALNTLISAQIDSGVEALVVLGTTGENPTITDGERRELTGRVIASAEGGAKVIVGTGTNSTAESISFSREAADAGADGLLIVGPYYNKPTQEGFQEHVKAIADATDCPQILYNVPGRTSFNILPETILALAEEVPSVVAVKEASGSLEQITDILAHRPDNLAVYSGDDEMTLPLVLMGGDGVVSVISNALPRPFSEMVRAALDDDVKEARRLHFQLLEAMRATFFATNPIPIKTVLAEAGIIEERFRLPLAPISGNLRSRILNAFADHRDGT